MSKVPGEATSLWLATTSETDYSSRPDKLSCDVLVVGAGMTGILTGWLLQQAGSRVVIVEKEKILSNTTGNTTAKLTSQHYLAYSDLVEKHGEEVARSYGQLNERAINDVEGIARSQNIDCDFSRRDAYVYTNQAAKVDDIKREVEITQKLGLSSSFESATELPFAIKGAIKFANQAQFHPRKFLLPLAEEFIKLGGTIYEEADAKTIEPGSSAHTLVTSKGNFRAPHIIEATREPFWRPKMFEKAMWLKFSYVLGVLIKDACPKGMYITPDEPLRSIRSHPFEDGEMLLFCGESHPAEEDKGEETHYQNLIDDVQQKFDVEKIVYRWAAGDMMPHDYMPYIGEYPDEQRIYVATGFRSWGLAWAMAAAKILSGAILDKPLEEAKPFSLARLKV